jgi:competence protein ComGC
MKEFLKSQLTPRNTMLFIFSVMLIISLLCLCITYKLAKENNEIKKCNTYRQGYNKGYSDAFSLVYNGKFTIEIIEDTEEPKDKN